MVPALQSCLRILEKSMYRQMSYFYTKWEYKWSNSFFAASLCDFKAMSDALILKDNEQMAVAAFMWCSVEVSPDSFELGRKGWW